MAQANQQQQNPQQQNFHARQRLLQTGISMVKQLPSSSTEIGGQLKIPLLRMGVMTGVALQFTVPVNITEAATRSPVAPWNIVQNIAYNDFSGTQRTRTNGFQLFAAQSFKQGDLIGAIPSQSSDFGFDSMGARILTQPTDTGEGEITFSLFVPMAYDANSDLTGAVLTQTNVGEHYITMQLSNNLVSPDPWASPYVGGAVESAGKIKVEAFQYYIQPQSMDMNQLPVVDLSTVYGFEGGYQTSANINAGQSTFINYPNNRAILSTLVNFENGGQFTPDMSDVEKVTVVANSNTNFREMNPRLIAETMRNIVNSDIGGGTYYFGSRRQPVMTQLYANVQAKFDVKNIVDNTKPTQFVNQFEVQYPSGAPLPGVTMAS